MVEHIEQLVSEEQYSHALAYAENLLLNNDNSPKELVAIYCAMAKCRRNLNEFYGALMSCQLTVKLAEDLQEWDYYGAACFELIVILDHLGQTDQAILACYDYLAHVAYYGKALEHQVIVWYNLGILRTKAGENHEAIKALQQGIYLAQRSGAFRQVHGLRHGLIQAFMATANVQEVPKLLAQCLHYLRHNPGVLRHRESLLFHFELRAEFALLTDRPVRALAVARRALRYADGYPENQFLLNMVCAKVSARLENLSMALAHALTARICAIEIRRFDLESLAGEFMYELAKATNDAFDRFPGDILFPRTENFSRDRGDAS